MSKPKLELRKCQQDYLADLVDLYSDENWKKIVFCMRKKFNGIQGSEDEFHKYWKNYLSGMYKYEPWTNNDRYILMIAHQNYKNKWAKVAEKLQRKSRNYVRNRFYELFRNTCKRIKKGDMNVESLLDLLEIYYIISLIEQYQELALENFIMEKNHLYKFVSSMNKVTVMRYKEELISIHNEQGSMNDLFEKCEVLYTKGSFDIKLIECEPIKIEEFEEEKDSLTLPLPKDFSYVEGLTKKEKNSFWVDAFLKNTPKSTQVTEKLLHSEENAMVTSTISQKCILTTLCEEGGFSEYIKPFETSESLSCYGAASFPEPLSSPKPMVIDDFQQSRFFQGFPKIENGQAGKRCYVESIIQNVTSFSYDRRLQ